MAEFQEETKHQDRILTLTLLGTGEEFDRRINLLSEYKGLGVLNTQMHADELRGTMCAWLKEVQVSCWRCYGN